MAQYQKNLFVFFATFTALLLSIVGYLYYKNVYSTRGMADISWDTASLVVKTNTGGCPTTFPCYETYELDSDVVTGSGANGSVLHNGNLQGHLPDAKTKDIIKTVFNLSQSNTCTPVYSNNYNGSQSYELIIDQKSYGLGNGEGCEEMQDIFNTIKEAVGV